MRAARACCLLALAACGPAEATRSLRPGESWSTPFETTVALRLTGHAVTTAPAVPAGAPHANAAMGHEYLYELVFTCDGREEVAALSSARAGTSCGHAWRVVENALPARVVLRVER